MANSRLNWLRTPCIMLVKLGSIPGVRTCVMVVRMRSILLGRIPIKTTQKGASSHITHDNVLYTHDLLMTINTWTPLMDPTSQELAGVASKGEHSDVDLASWKLTGEKKLKPITQVNACSLKLIWSSPLAL